MQKRPTILRRLLIVATSCQKRSGKKMAGEHAGKAPCDQNCGREAPCDQNCSREASYDQNCKAKTGQPAAGKARIPTHSFFAYTNAHTIRTHIFFDFPAVGKAKNTSAECKLARVYRVPIGLVQTQLDASACAPEGYSCPGPSCVGATPHLLAGNIPAKALCVKVQRVCVTCV